VRSRNCELQKLCERLGVTTKSSTRARSTGQDRRQFPVDHTRQQSASSAAAASPPASIQQVSVIGANNRGFNTDRRLPFGSRSATSVRSCGQCIQACPTGALTEKDDTDKVWEALADPELTVVVQTAPSIRAALGEEFGMPIGTQRRGQDGRRAAPSRL
jgi:NADP-reducing hydrogenase subunit HndD